MTTVPGIATLISLILSIVGIVMIFMHIKDDSFIDIKATLINGKLKSGFVGVLLLFISLILGIFSLNVVNDKKVVIEKEGVKVEYVGAFTRKSMMSILEKIQQRSSPDTAAVKRQVTK